MGNRGPRWLGCREVGDHGGGGPDVEHGRYRVKDSFRAQRIEVRKWDYSGRSDGLGGFGWLQRSSSQLRFHNPTISPATTPSSLLLNSPIKYGYFNALLNELYTLVGWSSSSVLYHLNSSLKSHLKGVTRFLMNFRRRDSSSRMNWQRPVQYSFMK